MILHITLPEDWAEARRTGRYAPSTRGSVVVRGASVAGVATSWVCGEVMACSFVRGRAPCPAM